MLSTPNIEANITQMLVHKPTPVFAEEYTDNGSTDASTAYEENTSEGKTGTMKIMVGAEYSGNPGNVHQVRVVQVFGNGVVSP